MMKMFRNRKYFLLDATEFQRRLRRQFDGNFSYRKLLLILFISAVLFLYIGPYIFAWLFGSSTKSIEIISRCMDDRLTPFYTKAYEFNAHIQHITDSTGQSTLSNQRNIPYVGNGYFGIEISKSGSFYLKNGRHLSQHIDFQPVVDFRYFGDGASDEPNGQQSIVVDYINGIVHKFQCFGNDFFISHDFYAHRVIPQLFVQEVKLTNLRNTPYNVDVQTLGPNSNWSNKDMKYIKLKQAATNNFIEFSVVSGTIPLPKNGEEMSVTIISQRLPSKIALKTRGVTKIDIIHVIQYGVKSTASSQSKQRPDDVEAAAIEIVTQILQQHSLNLQENSDASSSLATKIQTYTKLRRQHIHVWNSLWETGFQISTSLADNVINGDQINATIYAVLSQVRSYEFESNSSEQFRKDIIRSLSYAEGCYDSYHTLQAGNLWRDMNDIQELNRVVNSWLLTLEKQGCHNLIKAGASGVLQAMVLSFGSLRFSNQHLELNIHPKFLHRDYFFRRLNYGNMTHINISIEVSDDNRANIFVALDRSDGKYYACDAGCLDEPVPLTQERKIFPVKMTEPLTAILYITQDREHIEELRHAIHVMEVIEAPAHEHHVIALHKHGHQLGGLPTFFWISVFVIIIVFHIFLCKLVIKEYCEPPEKLRYRYDKP